MNKWRKRRWLFPLLPFYCGLATQVTAQMFTTLHSFSAGYLTNNDGAYPLGLIVSGGILYGTAEGGGSSGNGTVFAVNTDGKGFTVLHNMAATGTNAFGGTGPGGLILSGNTLYGTASSGGSSGNGAVFAVNINGTGFTNLHSFTATPSSYPLINTDGAGPSGGLTLSGNTLYGTTKFGGSSGSGTVFKINTDGAGFTNLHVFTSRYPDYANGDGAWPPGGLVLSGNILYGTTSRGGSSGNGTVFAVNTDGTGFTNLHSFTSGWGFMDVYFNSDGAFPYAGLILSGNTLYGTAAQGGSSGGGTVFAVNTDGTGFTNLHSLTGASDPASTNSDGSIPVAGLIANSSGNTLYGTATMGGSSGNGAVFAVNIDGTGFTNLHSFTATSSHGADPWGRLLLSGNTLYGTTRLGGSYGNGTVFSLSFTPQLTITPLGDNVILSWPSNYAGFDYTGCTLQSTTNLGAPIWTTNLPPPVVVNGLNTVTNPISGTQQSFRLSQ